MLHGRAGMRPDEVGFTFTDYTADPAGAVERVTWSQLYRRTLNAAAELRLHASVGDRAVILAPQGMEYITAFLGCMQAGVIAVPLPLPHRGSGDDRVSAVVDDTAPSIVLTTSAVTADVAEYLDRARLGAAPKILDVDAMDLDGPADEGADSASGYPATAYLQYSSGSTRRPTGVMVSHRNLKSNFEQLMRGYFAESQINTNGMTIVSWLPFYHDMGLVLGVCAPILGGFPAALTSPVAFLEKPSRWMQALADNARPFSAAPNFAFELAARKTRDADLAGRDLGGVLGIINGAERVDPATLERFADRFSHFNFRDSMLRPSYGLAEATVFVAAGTWKESEPAVRFDADELAAGCGVRRKAARRWCATSCPSRRWCASSTPTPAGKARRMWSVRSGCTATTSRPATGGCRRNPNSASAQHFSNRRPAPRTGRGCAPGTWASCSAASCSSSAGSRTC